MFTLTFTSVLMYSRWESRYWRLFSFPGDRPTSGSLAFLRFASAFTCLGTASGRTTVIETLRTRRDAGMEVVGGASATESSGDLERFEADLRSFCEPKPRIDRVIVAMENRRGSMPVRELLDLRLRGVVIEDASFLMERLLGRLPLDGLNPSALIFTHGFNVKASQQIVRRLVSILVSFTGLMICLPFIPFIMLAVRLSSPGPIFFQTDSSRPAWAGVFCHQVPDDVARC